MKTLLWKWKCISSCGSRSQRPLTPLCWCVSVSWEVEPECVSFKLLLFIILPLNTQTPRREAISTHKPCSPSVPVTCHRCYDICMCSVRSRRAGFMHRPVFCQRMNSLSKARFWEISWFFQRTAGLIEKVEMQNNDWGVFFLSLFGD